MSKIKTFLLFFGDIIILYSSLILTLLIRYGDSGLKDHLLAHIKPFSLIFLVWIIIFYISDLYKDKFLKYDLNSLRKFGFSILISFFISIFIFYIFGPFFKLTPKTNLLIFAVIFGFSDYALRLFLAKLFISGGLKKQIIILGESENINLIVDYIKNNPQTGYNLISWIKENLTEKNFQNIIDAIKINKIDTLIININAKKDPATAKLIYNILPMEIQILNSADFFEMIFQKLPLKDLEESWFIEEITTSRRAYELVKKIIDILLSFVLIIIFFPLLMLITILIKATSQGPAVYKQERIGKNNKPFILYKFRTMKTNGSGPLWTIKNDSRLTFIGKILRYTHADEFPQLFNVLKEDISFIGPRPERSELVELYKNLPHYNIRHIIKPGITGWAQLNYKPSASIEEAFEKLQYDIYYIKNRSLILDFLIILKTIKYVFLSHE